MFSLLPRRIEVAVSALLIALYVAPGPVMAQTHVVNPADVQKQVLATGETRRHNEETVQKFVSSPQAVKAIHGAGMDPERVKVAVPTLSDAELAQIAARADKAQADFAAGMSNHDLLLITVAVAVLILLIVAIR